MCKTSVVFLESDAQEGNPGGERTSQVFVIKRENRLRVKWFSYLLIEIFLASEVRSGDEGSGFTGEFSLLMELRPVLRVCEIGNARLQIREDFADYNFNNLADWKVTLSRKTSTPDFNQVMEKLRVQSFDGSPWAEVAGGVLVTKYGAGAVLVAAADKAAPIAYAVHPGVLVGGQVARLLDRGYQKFIKTNQLELPATASQLHAIHRFSEELKQITGDIDLYNESLGTTSDVYLYDRLKGREA
jgi:hypothetical protein